MKKFWAKITRKASEEGVYPNQQATFLDRVSDFFVLFPYGMHANLPPEQLGLVVDVRGRVFIGTSAVGRIAVEEGEVVFYHPQTKSKIHFKASGDLDIDTTDATGDVNIKTTNVNVDADQVNLGTGGSAIARVGDAVQVTVSGGSSAGVHGGTIIAGGVNTSI